MTNSERDSRSGADVHGMLLLDKPSGPSSNRALQIAKRLLGIKKAGHTGTLDPIATGLLPLCFGKATRISGFFLNFDKSYRVTLQLGISTDSGDREGKVIQTSQAEISLSQVEAALERFCGPISQIPPMHSALKHKGKPLYKLARTGVEIAREAREVTVYQLDIINFEGMQLMLDVSCSKGFYIRSLATDIGQDLGCGAHVKELRRTAVGRFTVDEAVTLDQLEAMETPEERIMRLIGTDEAVRHLPKVLVPENQVTALCTGQSIAVPAGGYWQGLARLYTPQDRFIGLGACTSEGKIQPKRIFV